MIKDSFNKLPDKVKNIITVLVFIIIVVIIYQTVTHFKDQREQKELDELKGRPGLDGSVRDPRPIVDAIFKKLNGYNFYYYPQVVNQLEQFSKEELTIAYNYFDSEYTPTVGLSLTEFIKAEWTTLGKYKPAIDKLERHGFH